MKILHISCINNIKSNGVAVAISSYLKYESKYSNIAIYNIKTDIEEDNIKCFNYKNYNNISSLPDGFNKPDLVIFNEVYKKEYIKLYKECLKNNIPYIVIPHGSLVLTAQKKKHFKKIIGNILLFNKFLRKAKAIQYLSLKEKENSVLKNKNYIISGNGVDKPKFINNYTNNDLVYIGRYDINTKGLDILVDVIKNNADWFRNNNIKLKLYGRTTSNDLEILKNMILNNKIDDVIIINDAVYNEEKNSILKNAYAFIQTSRHEGQPMGIMEALSVGLPCIVTYQTNFGEFINKYNCGIGVNIDLNEIFLAIKKIYEDNNLRNTYSNNAYKYTNEIYNFDNISKECIEEYKKIIER